jgi:thymidylate kinase
MMLLSAWRKSILLDACSPETVSSEKRVRTKGGKVCVPRLVAFFGPDGAGKSTQTELLVDYLRSNGFKVKKAWVRSTHTFAYLLWRVFYKLDLFYDRSGIPGGLHGGFALSYLNEDPYGAVSPITMSPPILKGKVSRFMWSLIEIVGIIPVVLLQVYVPLLLGRVVVAERFMADSVASIAYFLDDESFAGTRRAWFLLRLVPKEAVFVFVDADFETILSRRGAYAGTQGYTDFHRHVFDKLAHRLGALYINTSKDSIEEAHLKILRFVSSHN